MARTKYKTKPVASIWMWAGVTGSALAGTAMNGWIATQWFSPTMGPLMAGTTGVMMSIMEYATAHYAFRRESGILGRAFCAAVLAFCILAFTLFATLAPLTKIIQQTLVDPTTTGEYHATIAQKNIIEQQITAADAELARLNADRAQCAADYPAPKWRTRQAQCRTKIDHAIAATQTRRDELADTLLNIIGQQSALAAAATPPTHAGAREAAMSTLAAVALGEQKMTELLQSGEHTVALFIALVRTLIAEIVILLGAWFTARFRVAIPLILNGYFLDNFIQNLDNVDSGPSGSEIPLAVVRQIQRQKNVPARLSAYCEAVRKNLIPELGQLPAGEVGINARQWREAMETLAVEGYVVAISIGHTKTKYVYPTPLHGALRTKYKHHEVYRLPEGARLPRGTVIDFRDPSLVRRRGGAA